MKDPKIYVLASFIGLAGGVIGGAGYVEFQSTLVPKDRADIERCKALAKEYSDTLESESALDSYYLECLESVIK